MSQCFEAAFQAKIKTPEELRRIIGSPPRKRTVIMCHGTFDLVHPGHLRHLIYAKTKADILVASITSDHHITKDKLRPYVPQALRAMNLAALECVDYVVIDPNPTPIANIAQLQPDLFAKGYEYSLNGVHPRTREEADVVHSYGGELIFTPGDIIYSSSAIIISEPPDIAVEKLVMLMRAEGLSFNDLRDSLKRMQGVQVHVLGDTIVDTLTQCTVIGGLTKTPTISVRKDRKIDYVGGAAIVAKHLRAAGARVTFSTVLGQDSLKNLVLADLEQAGVTCRAAIDPTRSTTNKDTIVAGGYRLLKVDTVDNQSISNQILSQFEEALASTPAELVIFSDFRHGIFNRQTIPSLTAAIPPQSYKVADSQVASRWGNILEFKGFDLVTPNEREARFALADQDAVIRPLVSKLYDEAQCRLLILKLGSQGLITCRSDFETDQMRSFFVLDSFASQVLDPVGAGDALLAYTSLAMASGSNELAATILGAVAAAIECERDGNIPISPDDMLERIGELERRVDYRP